MVRKIKATRSTGNVFRDLGLPPAEATRLLIRADLPIEIENAKARRLTNQALAKVLGVSRGRVDDLRRQRLRRFTTDALIVDMLSRLGVDVRLVVRSTKQRSLPTESATAEALGQPRRLRRPLPRGFAFRREEANER